MQAIKPAWKWDKLGEQLTPLPLLIRLLNQRNQLLEQHLARMEAIAQLDLGIVGVEEFGNNVGAGNDDTTAFRDAMASGYSIRMLPNTTYVLAGDLQYQKAGQELIGGGDTTLVSYVGGGTPLSLNGKSNCKARRFKLQNDGTGVVGIDLPFLSHFWGLDEVHIKGFSIAGARVASAYYGRLEHCDIENCTIGLQGVSDFNGNFVTHSSFRQNIIGISVEHAPAASDASCIDACEIESARAGTQYGIQLLGTTGIIVQGTRMELTQGLAHVLVSALGADVSQFNQFIACPLEGVIPSYIIGDGIGASQVIGTYVDGGRAAGAIVINSDALATMMIAPPSSYPSALTDNGFGSIILLDPTSGKWYIKPSSSNVAKHKLTVGGVSTVLDVADNNYDVKNNSGTAFRVEPGGRVRAPIGSLAAGGDSGPLTGTVGIPNVADLTARGAGVGTILFNDGIARNCVGFRKEYGPDGGTYYVPLFSHS